MERVRILILTASIGSGHTRAAEAIRAALAAHTAAAKMQVDVVDFMAREVSAIHYLMKRIYLLLLRFVALRARMRAADLCAARSRG